MNALEAMQAAARARRAAAARARRQDPAVRAREAEERRQRRADPEKKAHEAEQARRRRQENLEAERAREAAVKRRKRSLAVAGAADARFKRKFLDRLFGHSLKVSVPPAIMRRRAATSHKQTTSCETGPSESTQAETLTTKVPMRMQTNELGDFHESSSAPQVPLESKVPLVQGNSSGASCAMQGHAKVGDATQENCQIKMEAGTSCIVKRENPFSANVCLVVSPYGCGICSRSFEEVDAVFSHVMACPWPEPFRCVLCPELCTNWGTARNHVVAHIQRRTPKCPLCGYAFGKQWTVERHVQMHHLPIRPFVCNCCGGTFTAKADIYKHSPQCRAKSQAIEKYLGSRKKSDSPVHGPVPTTVYKCSVCTRAFLDRLVMARHMRVHVNQVQQSRADEEVKKDPFDCGNHKSYGIGPPKVKNGVKVYTQCFIKIPVADKTTGCKAFSKATQTDLSSSTVSSWTQCDNVEDSEGAF